MQLQFLHFALGAKSSLPSGKAKLAIEFTSPVHPEKTGYGIYRIGEGPNHVGYVTQFEPVGAREAFPCFDEPSIRATFQVRCPAPSSAVPLMVSFSLEILTIFCSISSNLSFQSGLMQLQTRQSSRNGRSSKMMFSCLRRR